LKAGIAPPPLITWRWTMLSEGFSWSRLGPTLPFVPASASVWQLPQFARKMSLPPVAFFFRARVGGDRGHVGGNRIGVLALHEVLRHRGCRQLDLVADDLLDRHLLEALLARGLEGVVEVRPLLTVCARSRQRVTTAALGQEEGLAAVGVAGLRDPARAAAGREKRGDEDDDGSAAPH
jgi:hypothetical protein